MFRQTAPRGIPAKEWTPFHVLTAWPTKETAHPGAVLPTGITLQGTWSPEGYICWAGQQLHGEVFGCPA